VVSLSSPTNAHIGAIGDYPTKVYCEYNGCSQFTNKNDCDAFTLANPQNCSWTPPGPTKTSNPEGGCCGEYEAWNAAAVPPTCEPTTKNICNPTAKYGYAIFWSPWTEVIPGPGGNVGLESVLVPTLANPWTQYCSQVTKGASYGFWFDVKPY